MTKRDERSEVYLQAAVPEGVPFPSMADTALQFSIAGLCSQRNVLSHFFPAVFKSARVF